MTNKQLSKSLGINLQNTKKFVLSLKMEYSNNYSDDDVAYIQQHSYKWQRYNTIKTIVSFANAANVSRQRVHKKALDMGILEKGSAKQIILSDKQLSQLKEAFHV